MHPNSPKSVCIKRDGVAQPRVLLTPYRSARLTASRNSLRVVGLMDPNKSVRKQLLKKQRTVKTCSACRGFARISAFFLLGFSAVFVLSWYENVLLSPACLTEDSVYESFASQKPNTARVLWSRKRAAMLWNVRLGAWRWEGGGPVSDRDSSVCTPSSTPTPHLFVYMVEHSPGSNVGQTGICVHISRNSPLSFTQEPGRVNTCMSLQPVSMKLFVHPLFNCCVSAVNLCLSDFHQQWVAGLCQWEGLPYIQPSYRWADLWGPGGR